MFTLNHLKKIQAIKNLLLPLRSHQSTAGPHLMIKCKTQLRTPGSFRKRDKKKKKEGRLIISLALSVLASESFWEELFPARRRIIER